MENYSFVSISALLGYIFLMIIFATAEKNRTTKRFMAVLFALILWTSGSFFMRIGLFPSTKFWYNISILGLLFIPYTIFLFCVTFLDKKTAKKFTVYKHLVLFIILVVNIVNIATGYFLAPPLLLTKPNGSTGFIYEYTPAVFFLYGLALFVSLSCFVIIYKAKKENPSIGSSLIPIEIGMGALFLGNVLITLPMFVGFPVDIFAGAVNALLLLIVMSRNNLFRLNLFISKTTGYFISAIFSALILMNIIPKAWQVFEGLLSFESRNNMMVMTVFSSLLTIFIYFCVSKYLEVFFTKNEEIKSENKKHFSSVVAKNLDVLTIVDGLADAIINSLHPNNLYISLLNEKTRTYEQVYSSNILDRLDLNIEMDNPIIQWIRSKQKGDNIKSFRRSVFYKSLWEKEKAQLVDKQMECVFPIFDTSEIIGLVFLTLNNRGKSYSKSDFDFMESLTAISSISIKNARLYQKAYEEARQDALTGLANRKYFYEELYKYHDEHPDQMISMMLINIDDFKLYNQLYGNKEGDKSLQKVAKIIQASVGDEGRTGRIGGKEFVAFLPGFDILKTKNLAAKIKTQISELNNAKKEYKLKQLTVSIGISNIPFGVSNIKQLMEVADLAVYQVKQKGKNDIMVYTMNNTQTAEVVDSKEDVKLSNIYSDYASTIYALTAAIDAKDHYTFSHSNNVAYYSTKLAYGIGMNSEIVEIVREAALLHDIGKIGIAEHILNKAGHLDEEEYEIMKTHVENSIGIIKYLPSLDYVVPAVIGHHERYDGRGYPRRMQGEDIPLSARILCIADSFDAMISERSYKKAFSVENSIQIIEKEAGKQFDPKLVKVFIDLIHNGTIVPRINTTEIT